MSLGSFCYLPNLLIKSSGFLLAYRITKNFTRVYIICVMWQEILRFLGRNGRENGHEGHKDLRREFDRIGFALWFLLNRPPLDSVGLSGENGHDLFAPFGKHFFWGVVPPEVVGLIISPQVSIFRVVSTEGRIEVWDLERLCDFLNRRYAPIGGFQVAAVQPEASPLI